MKNNMTPINFVYKISNEIKGFCIVVQSDENARELINKAKLNLDGKVNAQYIGVLK